MPPRRGKVKPKARRGVEWSPRVALALTIGEAPSGRPVPEASLRAAWEAQREFLIATADDVASGVRGFWRFEPGLPAALRHEPSALLPIAEAERARAERESLFERRRAWLVEHRPDLARTPAA